MECYEDLKCAPTRLALEDLPSPTSFGLTEEYYLGAKDIFIKIAELLGKDNLANDISFHKDHPHAVPGDWFKGPF